MLCDLGQEYCVSMVQMLQMLVVVLCAAMACFLLLMTADNLLFEHVSINIPKLMLTSLWQSRIVSERIQRQRRQIGEFWRMVQAISKFGSGYQPPGYNQLRAKLLDGAKTKLEAILVKGRNKALNAGLTFTTDGFSDQSGHC
jgi:hypothetical protein